MSRPLAPSPTALTLAELGLDGWTANVVEARVAPRVTRDLFGCIDILAIRGAETLAVQCTSKSNIAARVRKVTYSPHLEAMREAGWRIEIWGWKTENKLSTCRKVDVS